MKKVSWNKNNSQTQQMRLPASAERGITGDKGGI